MSGGPSTGMSMMSEEHMQALGDATGMQAGRLFCTGMIQHHNGAIEMATRQIVAGRYPEAIELAKRIRADQQAEISEMQQLLARA